MTLSGLTIRGEQASRDVWVCGAGAFVVLKALAFDGRGENKDAYDLIYLLRNYGDGIEDVFRCLEPLLNEKSARQAIAVLKRDFTAIEAVASLRLAEFLGDRGNEGIRADAAGAVRSLLSLCRRT